MSGICMHVHTPMHTTTCHSTTHYYIFIHTAFPNTHLRSDCVGDEVYELSAFDNNRTQQHALPNAMLTTSTAITAAATMHIEQDMVVPCTSTYVCVCACQNHHIVSYVSYVIWGRCVFSNYVLTGFHTSIHVYIFSTHTHTLTNIYTKRHWINSQRSEV
jgi:hypothetical protein